MNEKFNKIRQLLKGTGMVNKLTPAYEKQYDKSPDETLKEDPKLKYTKKTVKI